MIEEAYKLQKIKDWISKEQDGLMDAQGNFEYPEHEGTYHILCNLDAYIDSLQEEPKPKFKIGDMVVSESGKYAKIESIDTDKYWCNGENGMSIPFKYQDKWKLVEEPVSENLEEAAYHNCIDRLSKESIEDFKAGSKWHKEQMMTKAVETTFNVSLPCGVYDKLKAKGCEEGNKLLVIKKDEL